jgi:hypothetical protein
MKRYLIVTLVLGCLFVLNIGVFAQEYSVDRKDIKGNEPDYSPYVDRNIPNRVYWGDTHHHTSYSPDAGLVGNTLDPEQAYRFARGDEVTSSSGLRVKLIRPLDFLVVSDHAEYIGLADMLRDSDPALLSDPNGNRWHSMYQAGGEQAYAAFVEIVKSATERNKLLDNKDVERTIWERFTAIADNYDNPGVFTAFIGFEWSSVPNGNNLHRVMIFRDNAARANQVLPYSLFDSEDPEDLWKYLADYEAKTGGKILAIPHNGNLSNGIMFSDKTFSGKPITPAYAAERMRWEPLVEVTQIKGDGEAHPSLSPDDEFADFETWDKGNLNLGDKLKEPWMLKHEYARSALQLGLELGEKAGVNPFKFGMIGSTDAHTSLATTREENYYGKFAQTEPRPDRYKHIFMKSPLDPDVQVSSAEEVASGLAAVWARENTREALWDAMKRKEVYATSGTRILVRVFAGWDFKADEVERPDFAEQGYARGVPMGGDLNNAPDGKAPSFMIRALRDPDGANLDRVQIIKGWLDGNGKTQEKIYDVAVSDGRKIGADGRCKTPVGNTVDVPDASFTNSIGDALFMSYWVDPDFDPKENAFYYVRVIEIPTPRWTAYDAKHFGVKMPDDVPMIVQDRAYTSPIWYTPGE